MADLKVDYMLLTSIQRTLTQQAAVFTDIGDQGTEAAVYGAGAVSGAMSGFAGNWARHREALVSGMHALARMAGQTSDGFHHTDHQLAGQLTWAGRR